MPLSFLVLAIFIDLPSKKCTFLHPKFYADYEYMIIVKNIFTNFEYTVSSYRIRFTCRFSKLTFTLRPHTLRGDLILRLRELELISIISFIKLKILKFNDNEIFITIILQTYFREFSCGFFKE